MKQKILTLLLFACALGGCMKSPDTDELSSAFVVQTAKDPDASFGGYKTYFLSDTIRTKTTNPNDSLWFDDKAKQLINTVKTNMSARGYTLVDRASKPDLGLGLSAIKDLNIGVIYPGWWWGYWGYWGGCYWGYCGYPPYYGWGGMLYSIPTGTLILDMIDLKNAKNNNALTVLWNAVMSGGLGSTSNDIQLGVNGIQQAFDQSPYVKTN